MLIRPEAPVDIAPLHELVRVAFETAAVSSGDEQNYMARLRAGPTYLPELALVAEDNGALIGQMMLSRIPRFVAADGSEPPTLLLAPLAVVAAERRRGVGTRLVETGLKRARDLGYRLVFLVGDPAYYGRFGFVATTATAVRNVEGIPDAYVLVRALDGTPETTLAGTVTIL